jgi:bacterioferritin
MALNNERTIAKQFPLTDHDRVMLDVVLTKLRQPAKKAIDATTHSVDAETSHDSASREAIIKLLNDSLATELVCVLRYKRHQFIADGLAMPKIAKEFLGYANEELLHADQLAQRIVQLGGQPDFSPFSLIQHSHAAYDDSVDLKEMISANLVAENAVIDNYCKILTLIGDSDLITRRLVEGILIDEMEHAEELRDWNTD